MTAHYYIMDATRTQFERRQQPEGDSRNPHRPSRLLVFSRKMVTLMQANDQRESIEDEI